MRKKCNNYFLTIAAALVFVLLMGTLPETLLAQNENPSIFALVEPMKTTPEHEESYIELELNMWKKLHQARVDKGMILGWYLYRVHYTGSADKYNYVTVTLFADRSQLEAPWAGIDPSEVMPDVDINEFYEETLASRDMVGSNLISRIESIYREGGPGDFKFLQIDYMKVKQGHDGDYIATEVNIWKAIHEQFIKAGSRTGWSLWGRVFPSGYALDYQYVTVNYFSDFSQIGTANYNDAYQKAHPDMEIGKVTEQTLNSRVLVRSELWKVVDKVVAEQ